MGDGNEAHVLGGGLLQNFVPNLGLGDHVQHGADFIADQKICPAHQGPCHAKALELPAGQLPGEPVQPGSFNAKGGQDVRAKLSALLQDLLQTPPGIDGLLRMLANQLNRADAFFGKGCSIQENFPLLGRQIPSQKPGQGAFSVAAGGKQPQMLAAFHGKAQVLQNPGTLPSVTEAHMGCLKSHGNTSPLPSAPSA